MSGSFREARKSTRNEGYHVTAFGKNSSNVRWDYLDSRKKAAAGVWTAFRDAHQALLEAAFVNGKDSVTLHVPEARGGQRSYLVDLLALRQANLKTGTKRAVRRSAGGMAPQDGQQQVPWRDMPNGSKSDDEGIISACPKLHRKALLLLSPIFNAIKRDSASEVTAVTTAEPSLVGVPFEIDTIDGAFGSVGYWSFGDLRRFTLSDDPFEGLKIVEGSLLQVAKANGKEKAAAAVAAAEALVQQHDLIDRSCHMAASGVLVPLHRFSLTLVGPSAAGKTSLVRSLLHKEFVGEHESTELFEVSNVHTHDVDAQHWNPTEHPISEIEMALAATIQRQLADESEDCQARSMGAAREVNRITEEMAAEEMLRMDTNGDGQVNRAEFVNSGGTLADFDRFDSDHNNILDLSEVHSMVVAKQRTGRLPKESSTEPVNEAQSRGSGHTYCKEISAR